MFSWGEGRLDQLGWSWVHVTSISVCGIAGTVGSQQQYISEQAQDGRYACKHAEEQQSGVCDGGRLAECVSGRIDRSHRSVAPQRGRREAV